MKKVNRTRVNKLWMVLVIGALVMLFKAPNSPLPSIAWAGTTPGSGMVSSGSPHNFAGSAFQYTKTNSHGTVTTTTGTVGLCTYCHTPHHAESTLLLWNQKLSVNTFAWDVPATTSGTQFPTFAGNTYMGPTAKCLSCHDGSNAIGDFNFYQGGGEQQGAPNQDATHTIASTSSLSVGFGGSMAGNHPVAMPYPYQQVANTYNKVTTGAYNGGLGFVPGEWVADPTANGIVLYNDPGTQQITAGPVVGKSGIECTSCHDPHNGPLVQDNELVLGLLSGDGPTYLCNKCHIK